MKIRRIKVATPDGFDYARRDENNTLIETGWIDHAGEVHPDAKIDGSNLAAMVPVTTEWA